MFHRPHISCYPSFIVLLFISSLFLSVQTKANQQGLALLIQQCLNQPGITLSLTGEMNPTTNSDGHNDNQSEVDERLTLAALDFERQTLGFQNIYTLLQYYQAKK